VISSNNTALVVPGSWRRHLLIVIGKERPAQMMLELLDVTNACRGGPRGVDGVTLRLALRGRPAVDPPGVAAIAVSVLCCS
jgi:hypothetical protein